MANKGLGRGLGSLIPNKQATVQVDSSQTQVSDSDVIRHVDINEIKANHLQPRKQFRDYKLEELSESIKEHGILQPLIATKKGDKYELIAGERRLRASKLAGLTEVPVIIREVDEQKRLELALIENIQREQLNPIDLAKSYSQLMGEFNLTQEDVAKKVGKARSSIANVLRMLKLPEEIQLALIDGKITEGHAKYLIGIEEEGKQLRLFRTILHNNLSVSDTSQEARKMGGTKKARVKINYTDKDKEFKLREFFGAKVEIKRKGKGGRIMIDFFSDDELQEIMGKIKS
ncbi:chromosome partitioning protein ParB [Candidatus Parcubacteria bacterium]|nr:MAG: chromosome partitioning protein ParB [Candidatus Parcubacteria bacterium]